jgi:hypothetical protein
MSLFKRFSVSYKMEQASKKKPNSTIQETSMKFSMHPNDKLPVREFIGEDLLKPLLGFGYDLDQIMMAFKIYRFASVDEALMILMRDSETGKFNHRFLNQIMGEDGYEDTRSVNCYLCGESRKDHVDLDIDLTHSRDAQLDVDTNHKLQKDDQMKETSFEHERSNLPMIKTSDQSGLLEQKLNSNRKKLNIQQIDIPKETLELFEDPEVCRICFAEVLNSTNKAQFACGHKFCKTCVTNHLAINITNGKVNIIFTHFFLTGLNDKMSLWRLPQDFRRRRSQRIRHS